LRTILVTGGAGYIGSHTCVELLNANYKVIVIDNLSNSKEESLVRVQKITNKSIVFHNVDLLDKLSLHRVFRDYDIEAVIHFAGLKAVGESTKIPLRYYQNNITGTIHLCEEMHNHKVKNIVFSSSATVYGDSNKVPIKENFALQAGNPYGRTKLFIEEILRDVFASDNSWNSLILRYFNPVGAHESGEIGEDPNGIPNNLMPYISQVAIGKLEKLHVYGDDYPTPDGTGVRDYIHVVDLAHGHVKALQKLENEPGIATYNLGTGRGYSVMEMLKAFKKVSGRDIPYEIVPRRPGDIATNYADPTLAEKELNWKATRSIDEMCADSWRWQERNPNGYE